MAKKLKETYTQADIHTGRLPLVVLSAAVAAKNKQFHKNLEELMELLIICQWYPYYHRTFPGDVMRPYENQRQSKPQTVLCLLSSCLLCPHVSPFSPVLMSLLFSCFSFILDGCSFHYAYDVK